jgi:hypothetical protein
MNCIAAAGSIYEEVDLGDLSAGGTTGGDIPVRFASFIMVLAMREVEYRTLHGTSRSLEDFSSLLGAFSRIITETSELTTITETEEPDIRFDTEDTSGRQVQTSRTTVIRQNPALERFFGVVSGCLDSNVVSPDTSAREPT